MKIPTHVLLFLALIASAFTGCKSVDKVVTARLEIQYGTNRAVIVQPKDTTIKRLVLNPQSGLMMEEDSSVGNAEAIATSEAQYRFSTQLMGQMQQQNMQMFQWLAQGAGQKFGVNMPQGPAIGQPPFQIQPGPQAINAGPVRVVESGPALLTNAVRVLNLIETNAPPIDPPPPK